MWAGNSGTPQGTGSGTCGSNPSNSLNGGASYSNQYVYTHLGQLWQGPYNGAGSYQYLYCNSSQPHQLTGLYPAGTTCSTTSGKTQTYGASYDSRGNMTTRIATGSGGTTATLSYDGQDHLLRWNDNNTTTNEEWYLYDASGQRVLYSDPRCQDKQIGVAKVYSPFLKMQRRLRQAFDTQELDERAAHYRSANSH